MQMGAVRGGISALVHSLCDDISVPFIDHCGRRLLTLHAIELQSSISYTTLVRKNALCTLNCSLITASGV